MTERTYRIGEVARLLKLEGYVLRFWETEFPELRPLRTPKGQRVYTEGDVRLLRRIRFLLHEQGMTIEGARRIFLEEGTRGEGLSKELSQESLLAVLQEVSRELTLVRGLLNPR